MTSRSRSAAVVLSAVALCLAAPTGPAFAARTSPAVAATPAAAQTAVPAEPVTSAAGPSTTATVVPRPAVERPDLRLSVWFGKPSYQATEQITAHARVTNVGNATASRVDVVSTGNLSTDWWSPFFPLGVPVEPGQTVDGTATGNVTTTSGPLTITVTAVLRGAEQDADPADNTVTVSVPVTHVSGSYHGTVYGDRNGNAKRDRGEALSGIPVYASGGVPTVNRSTITDGEGHFNLPDLPAGSYWTSIDVGAAWYVMGPGFTVSGADVPDVLIEAVPAVDTLLSTSLAFTRPSYRKGDVARMTLTLANRGDVLIANLTAECRATGSGQVSTGELAVGGQGVAVAAGKTRTFGISVGITADVAADGYVRVGCTVGAPPVFNGFKTVQATARIPGGVAPKAVGYLGLFKYRPQQGPPVSDPLPGVKVYLRDQLTRAVVARAVTGADGRFAFFDVPAGLYDFGIVGPWEFSYYHDVEFPARAGENGPVPGDPYRHFYYVVPGPDQPDPDAVTSPAARPVSTAPPAAARPTPAPPRGLATTGVEVTWLALGAFLTTTTGAALVFGASRRRRPGGDA